MLVLRLDSQWCLEQWLLIFHGVLSCAVFEPPSVSWSFDRWGLNTYPPFCAGCKLSQKWWPTNSGDEVMRSCSMHPRGLVFFQYQCLANNKLENVLHLVIKGHLNSDCFMPKAYGVCNDGSANSLPLNIGVHFRKWNTNIQQKHSLEPQNVGCLLHPKLFLKKLETLKFDLPPPHQIEVGTSKT